jgi:UDP-glucose 4-epimerase
MRVLVTGATGLLGPYVLRALSQDGMDVRVAVRGTAGDNIVPATVAVGPIGRDTDWRSALAGIDAVVHLAARAHRPPAVQAVERELYMDVNCHGTLQLARAAADAGVRHLIFTSTIGVLGAATDGRRPFSDDDPLRPQTVYAETKAAAERGLAAIAEERKITITAVRPPLIYGRNAQGSFAVLLRALRAGLPLPLASIRNRRAFVAAENVAGFIAHRLQHPASGYQAFIVADGEPVSTPDFVRSLAAALGTRARLLSLPEALLKRLLAWTGRAHLTDSLLGSLEVDTGKARATGWRPAVTLEQGLAAACQAASPPKSGTASRNTP